MGCGVNKLIFGITGTEEPKIFVMARQEARGKRQEARVKRVWAILLFFT
jgi:hypothetical protein